MLALPLPFVVAEFIIFFMLVKQWGFLNTLGIYLLPCLLGALIVLTVGRVALLTLQATVTRGKLPTNQLLHSGAIFIAGLLFLVPSVFTRVFGLILFLPGLRHIVLWRFKLNMAKKMASGGARVFNFGNSGFGASSGFGFGKFSGAPFEPDFQQKPGMGERDVTGSNYQIDVTPIEVIHEVKKGEE